MHRPGRAWALTAAVLPAVLLLGASPARTQPAPVTAVFDIEFQGVRLGGGARERLTIHLSGRLAATARFRLVPRDQLKARLSRQKVESLRDCYDQSCQIELGKELAAEKTLQAQVVKVGSRCAVNLSLFDLKQAATEAGASVKGPCSEDGIVASLEKAVRQLAGEPEPEPPSPPVTAPAPRDAPEPLPPQPLPSPVAPFSQAVSPAPAGDARLQWIALPGGRFRMGSEDGGATERPVHDVSVRPFQMTRTEVTFGQYGACVTAGACSPPHVSDGTCYVFNGTTWEPGILATAFQGADQPVVCVDWDQAVAFARWAGGRLPTEAEWEFAARNGGRDAHPWGDSVATCARAVMNDGSGNGCGRHVTWPVCSRPSGQSLQGLCDLSGNVWEWVQDWYHKSYDEAPDDGSAWLLPVGTMRVFRGGSWFRTAKLLRAASRNRAPPANSYDGVGFRVAR